MCSSWQQARYGGGEAEVSPPRALARSKNKPCYILAPQLKYFSACTRRLRRSERRRFPARATGRRHGARAAARGARAR